MNLSDIFFFLLGAICIGMGLGLYFTIKNSALEALLALVFLGIVFWVIGFLSWRKERSRARVMSAYVA